jgi:hypothetical protein
MATVRYPITIGVGDVYEEVGWIEAEVSEDIRPALVDVFRMIANELESPTV